MSRFLRVLCAALVVGALAPLAGAQVLDDSDQLLAAYAAIAEEYRRGDADAVRRLMDLGPQRLNTLHQIMADALRRSDVLTPKTGAWSPALLRAAAMLHTELALRAHELRDVPKFRQQMEAADRVLQVAEQREPSSGFRSRWQIGIGLHILAAGDIDGSYVFLSTHCRSRTAGAPVRLACGFVSVTSAEWMRAPLPPDRRFDLRRSRAVDEVDVTLRIVGRLKRLDEAIEHFQAALAADRSLEEAALRLAHVHILRRKDAEAAPLLATLAETSHSGNLAYLARLMSGGIREREGDAAGAAALYRRASEIYPDAPAARLARAQLLHATNERTAAREIVEALVTPALRPPDDPWPVYHVRLVATPYASLDDLRHEVRK